MGETDDPVPSVSSLQKTKIKIILMMNLEEAKNHIGKMVLAADSIKLIKGPHKPHGPYLLIRVTKGGLCELERDENRHGTRFVKPTLISLFN